ncbi:hypothetical protein AAHA92_10000 [Salvia divinorum]|uniref:Uncharacterized protein n=1 Tax=Salvia divinorum TaxID=28513 RepID=A0ABD1HUL3_SALDI
MCHLPVGVEHKAYWAIKEVNLNACACEEERRLQLQELEELKLESYDSMMWVNGAVELKERDPDLSFFLVNGHRVKVFRDSSELCMVEEIPLRMPVLSPN